MSVCLSVCPLAYLKNPHVQSSRNFMYVLHGAVARSSSDDSSCTGFVDDLVFSHNGPCACGGSSSYVSAVLKQLVKISNVFSRGRHAV